MNILTYPSDEAENRLASIINRSLDIKGEVYDRVAAILSDVKERGDEALIEYTRQFDAPELTVEQMAITPADMEAALGRVDSAFLSSLDRAIEQIRQFHQRQVRNSWISTSRPGVMLGQLFSPVDAAGIYVPGAKGGLTPLVSSVLMGAIPAKIAGVGRTVMVTPPTRAGDINPHLLAAAGRVGIDAVYKAGSAWAVAALAYGTQTLPKVDVIVGPGNIYVTLAKKMLSGTVGIDMIAGPSEILVIADKSANPRFIAADMLSQAEHDILASAMLITDSAEVAHAVENEIKQQLSALERQDIARQSLADFGAILVVADITAAIGLSNRIAPEHLELMIDSPFVHLGQIRNAGAVFVGEYTPEPVGDYIAGTNHVLPTGGTARFSSALSVDTFVKQTSLIHYSRAAFEHEAGDIIRLAETEALGAHAGSVRVRLEDLKK